MGPKKQKTDDGPSVKEKQRVPFLACLDSGRYGAVGRLAALRGSLSVAFAALAQDGRSSCSTRQLTDAFHPLEQVEEEAKKKNKGFFF